MRVIAGTARGRPLRAPAGTATRPTSDRVREALFSSLAPVVSGAQVLDLYAGSGALAIEALSRGACNAVLAETDAAAVRVIRANLRRAGVDDRATVRREPAARVCSDPPARPFSLILADPPYAEPLAAVWECLAALHAAGGLASGCVVVVERDRRDPGLAQPLPPFLAPDRRRPYGDTVLLYATVA